MYLKTNEIVNILWQHCFVVRRVTDTERRRVDWRHILSFETETIKKKKHTHTHWID